MPCTGSKPAAPKLYRPRPNGLSHARKHAAFQLQRTHNAPKLSRRAQVGGAAHPPSTRARRARNHRRARTYFALVHVHEYKLRLEPALWSPAALTPEALAESLATDAVVQELAPHPSGGGVAVVAINRDRDSHEEALDELFVAAQELGYAFVEAEITKVADRAIEMAVGGGITGLGAGSTTENAELALLGAGIGWVVGLLVGANMQKAEVLYRAQWTPSGWLLTPVAPQPAVASAVRPAFGDA